MGSGDRAYRIELGAARGQAQAIQEHERAMIPIVTKRGEAELALQKQAAELDVAMRQQLFEQQMSQAEEFDLVANRLAESEQERLAEAVTTAPAPAGQVTSLIPPGQVAAAPPPVSKKLIYVGLAIAAFFFLRS